MDSDEGRDSMNKRKNERSSSIERSTTYSPKRLLLTVALSIFLCEFFVMIIFSLFHFSHWFHAFLDAFLLLILISPALYFSLFRPMMHHTMELKGAEEVLQRAHDELERRVEERTKDLEKANEQLRLQMNKIKDDERKIQHKHDTESITNSLLRLSLEDIPIEEILQRALELIMFISWLAFEAKGCVFLVEEEKGSLVMKAQSKLDEPIQKECGRLPFGRCLCGRAALKKEIEFADCIDDRHEILYEGMTPHGHYCVPILYAGKVLGVINLYVKEGHKREENEEGFLTAIANTLAGIIQRKHLDEERQDTLVKLRRAMGGSIQLLADTAEVKDPYTAGHQRRTADLGRSIATEMGLTKDQIDGIRMAGVVHDVGKIAIPAEILSKPSRLTEIEFGLIKTHSQLAYDILKKIDFPWPVALITYQHHERMDGSGYPQGLRGEEITLGAKILAVADVVEAMAFDRPYRPAFGMDVALEEISNKRGITYDPDVVDACLKIVREKGFKFK